MLAGFDSRVSYRDRVYIVKDVILKLVEYGELNLKKHRPLLDELENKGLISRVERPMGKRTVTFYRTTDVGMEF